MKERFGCYGWAGAAIIFLILAVADYIKRDGGLTVSYYALAALVTFILFMVCRKKRLAAAGATRQRRGFAAMGAGRVHPQRMLARLLAGVGVPLALLGMFVIRSPHVVALAAILLGVAWWLKKKADD